MSNLEGLRKKDLEENNLESRLSKLQEKITGVALTTESAEALAASDNAKELDKLVRENPSFAKAKGIEHYKIFTPEEKAAGKDLEARVAILEKKFGGAFTGSDEQVEHLDGLKDSDEAKELDKIVRENPEFAKKHNIEHYKILTPEENEVAKKSPLETASDAIIEVTEKANRTLDDIVNRIPKDSQKSDAVPGKNSTEAPKIPVKSPKPPESEQQKQARKEMLDYIGSSNFGRVGRRVGRETLTGNDLVRAHIAKYPDDRDALIAEGKKHKRDFSFLNESTDIETSGKSSNDVVQKPEDAILEQAVQEKVGQGASQEEAVSEVKREIQDEKQQEIAELERLLSGPDIVIENASQEAQKDAYLAAEQNRGRNINTMKQEAKQKKWWTFAGIKKRVEISVSSMFDRAGIIKQREQALSAVKEHGHVALGADTVTRGLKSVTDAHAYQAEQRKNDASAMISLKALHGEMEYEEGQAKDEVKPADAEQQSAVLGLFPDIIKTLYNGKRAGAVEGEQATIEAQKSLQAGLRTVLDNKAILYRGNMLGMMENIAALAIAKGVPEQGLSAFIAAQLQGKKVHLADLVDTRQSSVVTKHEEKMLEVSGNATKWLNRMGLAFTPTVVASAAAAVLALGASKPEHLLLRIPGAGGLLAVIRTLDQEQRTQKQLAATANAGETADVDVDAVKRYDGKLMETGAEAITVAQYKELVSAYTTQFEKAQQAFSTATTPEKRAVIEAHLAKLQQGAADLYQQTRARVDISSDIGADLILEGGIGDKAKRFALLTGQARLKMMATSIVVDSEESQQVYKTERDNLLDKNKVNKKDRLKIAGKQAAKQGAKAVIGTLVGGVIANGLHVAFEHFDVAGHASNLYQGVREHFVAGGVRGGGQGGIFTEALASGHTGATAGGETQMFTSEYNSTSSSLDGTGSTHVVGETSTTAGSEHTGVSHTETRTHTEHVSLSSSAAEHAIAKAHGLHVIDPNVHSLHENTTLQHDGKELQLHIKSTPQASTIDVKDIVNARSATNWDGTHDEQFDQIQSRLKEHTHIFINLTGHTNESVIDIPVGPDGVVSFDKEPLKSLIAKQGYHAIMTAVQRPDGSFDILNTVLGNHPTGSMDINITETVSVPSTEGTPGHNFVGPPRTTSATSPDTGTTGGFTNIPPQNMNPDTGTTGGFTNIPPQNMNPGVDPLSGTVIPAPLVGQTPTPGFVETMKNGVIPILYSPTQEYIQIKPETTAVDSVPTAAQRLAALKKPAENPAPATPVPAVEKPAVAPVPAVAIVELAAVIPEGEQEFTPEELAIAAASLAKKTEDIVGPVMGDPKEGDDAARKEIEKYIRSGIEDEERAAGIEKLEISFLQYAKRALMTISSKSVLFSGDSIKKELTQSFLFETIDPSSTSQEQQHHFSEAIARVLQTHAADVAELSPKISTDGAELTPLQNAVNAIIETAKESQDTQSSKKITSEQIRKIFEIQKDKEFTNTPKSSLDILSAAKEHSKIFNDMDGISTEDKSEDTEGQNSKSEADDTSNGDEESIVVPETPAGPEAEEEKNEVGLSTALLGTLPVRAAVGLKAGIPGEKIMAEIYATIAKNEQSNAIFQKVITQEVDKIQKVMADLDPTRIAWLGKTIGIEKEVRRGLLKAFYLSSPNDASQRGKNIDDFITQQGFPPDSRAKELFDERISVITTDYVNKLEEAIRAQSASSAATPVATLEASLVPDAAPAETVEPTPVAAEIQQEREILAKEPVPLSEKYSSKMVEQLISSKTKDDETYIRMNRIIAEINSDPEAQKIEEKIVEDSLAGIKTAIKNMFKYATLSEVDQTMLLPDETTIKQMLHDEILENLRFAGMDGLEKSVTENLEALAVGKKGDIISKINNVIADHLYEGILDNKKDNALRSWFINEITNKKPELYERNSVIAGTPQNERKELSFEKIVDSIGAGQPGAKVQRYARAVLKHLLHQARQHK